MTRTAYAAAVTVPEGCDGFQSVTGRLWDVCWVARCEAKRHGGSRVRFSVSVVTSKGGKRRNVHLEMVCGPGDTPEPVLTIQLPGED